MEKLNTCKACGNDTFAQGDLGHGYANIRPVGKKFKTGSPLLITYCDQCGEVASIKVKDLGMMRLW